MALKYANALELREARINWVSLNRLSGCWLLLACVGFAANMPVHPPPTPLSTASFAAIGKKKAGCCRPRSSRDCCRMLIKGGGVLVCEPRVEESAKTKKPWKGGNCPEHPPSCLPNFRPAISSSSSSCERMAGLCSEDQRGPLASIQDFPSQRGRRGFLEAKQAPRSSFSHLDLDDQVCKWP